jgi:hypothetical protein
MEAVRQPKSAVGRLRARSGLGVRDHERPAAPVVCCGWRHPILARSSRAALRSVKPPSTTAPTVDEPVRRLVEEETAAPRSRAMRSRRSSTNSAQSSTTMSISVLAASPAPTSSSPLRNQSSNAGSPRWTYVSAAKGTPTTTSEVATTIRTGARDVEHVPERCCQSISRRTCAPGVGHALAVILRERRRGSGMAGRANRGWWLPSMKGASARCASARAPLARANADSEPAWSRSWWVRTMRRLRPRPAASTAVAPTAGSPKPPG